jgi:hypothetical protein
MALIYRLPAMTCDTLGSQQSAQELSTGSEQLIVQGRPWQA